MSDTTKVEVMEIDAGAYVVKGRITEIESCESENAFEYEVSLIKGETVVDKWYSLYETYNGQSHLSYKNAKGAVWEIAEDVRNGDVDEWFDV